MSELKPKIIVCSTPVYGHVMPSRAVAKELIVRGYDVTFITGSEYREKIIEVGATFIPLLGYADWTEVRLFELIKSMKSSNPPSSAEGMIQAFIDVIPEQFAAVQLALKSITQKDPDARIIVLSEGSFRGALPAFLGAPGIRPLGHLAISVVPLQSTSIDTAPFGPGLPPDSSPEGRKRNIGANKQYEESMAPADLRFKEIFKELGASVPELFFQDAKFHLIDRWIQMCTPSMEYPRSDTPPTVRYAGSLPPGARDLLIEFPVWWNEVAVNAEKKSIVFVCQGTISTDSQQLVIPTMKALKDDKDILVVAALGKKGATLPEGTIVPANARVIDFIPYDEVLRLSDIFITNGGFGAVQHSLRNGVPLVVAGQGADKAENAMRVEWAGVGLNLRTILPTSEAISEAAKDILGDAKYKKRALEIQAEIRTYDPVGVIIDNINEVITANSKAS